MSNDAKGTGAVSNSNRGRGVVVAALLACLTVLGCSKQQESERSATAPSSSTPSEGAATAAANEERLFNTFLRYPGAEMLCQASSLGATSEVNWFSFATPASTKDVVAFYERDRGTKAAVDPETRAARFEEGSTVLSIHDVGEAAKLPKCNKSPPSGARSIILVSQMIHFGRR